MVESAPQPARQPGYCWCAERGGQPRTASRESLTCLYLPADRPRGRASSEEGGAATAPERAARKQVVASARVLRLGIAPSRIPHEPSDQADGCQSENPVLQEPPGLRRTSFGGVGQRAVNIRSRRRDRRAGPSAPLGHRYPSRDGREHFGRADRALWRVMNFLAVQTQSSDSKLHTSVYPTSRTKVPRSVRTLQNGRRAARRRGLLAGETARHQR